LRDLGDAERDELLGLARDRAVLERLLIELEERAIRLRHELAHALELRLHVDVVKLHDFLLDWVASPMPLAPGTSGATRPPTNRLVVATSGRRNPWRRPPGSGASSPPTAPAGRRSASARRERSRRGAGSRWPRGSCAGRCSRRAPRGCPRRARTRSSSCAGRARSGASSGPSR